MKLKWYQIPAITFSLILVFAGTIYVIMGVDLFPGHDGNRWATLTGLTLASYFLCGLMSGD